MHAIHHYGLTPDPSPYKSSAPAHMTLVFTIALICGLLKGSLTFFKFFQATRYLVKMIVTIFYDLYAFVVVLVASNFVFAAVFQSLDLQYEAFVDQSEDYKNVSSSLEKSFLQSWDMMLGYGEYKFRTYTGILVYFMATIFNNIVMLNMVISVVSDTYDKVQLTM